MNTYRIIANQIELDTYDDINVSLNYQIQDILDISQRKTSWSKTISLPGTPANNKFFKQIFEVNIHNVRFNPNKRIPAIVRIGDNEIFNGYLRLLNVFDTNKEITYEISITGSIKDIIKTMQDYTLRDLDLSEYDHIRNIGNISNSWEFIIKKNGIDKSVGEPGQGYVYPYIVNGNSENIYETAYIYDLFPAVYVKTVVDKLFEFAGFTFTSTFFESEYFKKLILPFVGDKLQLPAAEILNRTVVAGVPSASTFFPITNQLIRGSSTFITGGLTGMLGREDGTVDDSSGDLTFTDTGAQWDGTVFTCGKTGRYNVDMDGKLIAVYTHDDGDDVEFKEGEFLYLYALYRLTPTGDEILLDSSVNPDDPEDDGFLTFGASSGVHPTPWFDIDTPLVFNMQAEDILLEVGDKIRMKYIFAYPNEVKWIGLDDNKHRAGLFFKQSLDESFTRMIIEPSSNEALGNELVQMNTSLPDKMKMVDFLYDLINMFNLIIMDNPNQENDLIIEPRDDFFASKQEVKQWDRIIDNDAPIKITPMSEADAKTYLYTYTPDGDFYNKEYTEETGLVYGEYSLDVINDFSDKIKKTSVAFAPTANAQKFIKDRVAPFFWEKEDDGYKPFKVKPRILFYGGTLPTNKFVLKDYGGSTAPSSTFTKYPYCGMWDHPTDPNFSLEFGNSKKVYWNSTIAPGNTLFNQYHKDTLNNIVNIDSRLLEADFKLTPKDLAEFDFRDIILLRSSYWRVNKIINYNPIGSDSTTKVQLFKLIDVTVISPYKIELPKSTKCPEDLFFAKNITTGVIIIKSKSGQILSTDCCKANGGHVQNGVCFKNRVLDNDLPGDTNLGQGPTIPSDGGENNGDIPFAEPTGTLSISKNQNSPNTPGVKIYGESSYAPPNAKSGIILGDNSSIASNVKGSFVVGDGVTATESGTFYLGNVKMNQDGNIVPSGINIIDGGEDAVFPFDKTNFIDILDGGEDAVRNFGGDSKSRPVIDGNGETI